MLGRGLRLYLGKSECVVLDCVDVCSRRPVLTLPSLLGLSPQFNMGGLDALTVYKRMEGLVGEVPGCIEAESVQEAVERVHVGRERVGDFELRPAGFQVKSGGRFPDRLDWVRVRRDAYGLSLSTVGHIVIIRLEPFLFGLYLKQLRSRQDSSTEKFHCLGMFNNLESAFKGASTYIKNCSYTVWKLADKDAEWKTKKATDAQLQRVKVILQGRLKNEENITKGFASYLIAKIALNHTVQQLQKHLNRPPADLTPLFQKSWKIGSLKEKK
eukprot:m.10409 g.10409  ORF g.10409 m.10409 type:complete len:270 (+) comp22279_c0_seq1:1119-1928(+)